MPVHTHVTCAHGPRSQHVCVLLSPGGRGRLPWDEPRGKWDDLPKPCREWALVPGATGLERKVPAQLLRRQAGCGGGPPGPGLDDHGVAWVQSRPPGVQIVYTGPWISLPGWVLSLIPHVPG